MLSQPPARQPDVSDSGRDSRFSPVSDLLVIVGSELLKHAARDICTWSAFKSRLASRLLRAVHGEALEILPVQVESSLSLCCVALRWLVNERTISTVPIASCPTNSVLGSKRVLEIVVVTRSHEGTQVTLGKLLRYPTIKLKYGQHTPFIRQQYNGKKYEVRCTLRD